MLVGILYLLAACFCWSIVFVVPELLTGFSPLEISLSRFFFFGIISIFLILLKRRELLTKTFLPIWKKAFVFGFASAIACYTFTVFCIKYAGSSTAALLFGTVPIIVALMGNLRRKEYPFKVFLWPLLVMGVGIVITNREAFLWQGDSLTSYFFGLSAGIVGIGCWIWYVIACFDFMEENKAISSMDWVMMLGSMVFCQVLILTACTFWMIDDRSKYFSFTNELGYFLVGTFALGVISSWGALYFWTQGNLRLPISMVGQVSIFELVFGLLLIYLVQKRIPSYMEITGIVLMIAGVLKGFYSLRKIPSKEESIEKL